MQVQIVTKEGFKGVGYTQTVTFEEAKANALHGIIRELEAKITDIPNVVNRDGLWALSHPVTTTGFAFYILAEVSDYPDQLPEGMIQHELPTLTYAKYYHEKDRSISDSYTNLFKWVEENGYKLNQQEVTHLEWYPIPHDLNNPDYDMLLPVSRD